MNFDELKKILTDEAAARGISEYELYYAHGSSISTETLKDEISSFSSGVDGGICFRCRVNGKMGYASTELFDAAEVRELVRRAEENAAFIEKDDGAEIFVGSPEYAENKIAPYHPKSAAELKKTALELQRALYAQSDKVTDGTQAYAASTGFEIRLFNSHGLDLSNRVGASVAYAAPVVRDGEESQEHFEQALLDEGTELATLAKKAVTGALAKLGADKVKTGKYNIVISGKQMRALLAAFSGVFSAKQAQLGLSLLAGREGERVASDIITLTDDPMRPDCLFTTNFDSEGVAARKKSVIEKGVLKTLLYNLETAKKAGIESTGNGLKSGYSAPVGIRPYAFCIEAGDKTDDELFALAESGIYITELKGLHAGANDVTGDFSVESAGFLIENGKIGKAVKTFTIAGNFFTLLKSAAALSDTVDINVAGGFTVFGSPAALFRDMSVAGE